MNKRNTPGTKEYGGNTPSSSQLIRFTTSATIIVCLFSATPSYNQTPYYPVDTQKKPRSEVLGKNTISHPKEHIDHETIIKKDIKDILDEYGKEKGLEIIRQHMLIEMNTYRKLHNRPELSLDFTLNTVAQKFAEYASPYKQLGHTFNGKGFDDMGIDLSKFSATGENVAYGIQNIFSIVQGRYTSPGHKKTMIGLRKSKISGDTLIFNSLGIGISGPFVVADFGIYKDENKYSMKGVATLPKKEE